MYRLKRTIGLIGCSMLLLWVLASCGNTDSNKGPVETSTKGNITIAIDPSFKPVLEQQLKVFDSSYPEAHVKGIYLNEADCFTRLFQDSVRLIMVSRDVTAAEKEAYKKREIKVKSLAVAMDAIAVIVNKKSVDSLMTMGQLKQIFLGGFARKYTIVFDKEEESILRYLADSLIPGQPLPSNIYGVANSDSLIAYVSKNENAIGFLGVTHVYDP
jgi:phosphate transport system substrate-binding protein